MRYRYYLSGVAIGCGIGFAGLSLGKVFWFEVDITPAAMSVKLIYPAAIPSLL